MIKKNKSRPVLNLIIRFGVMIIVISTSCQKIPGLKQMYEENLQKGKAAFHEENYSAAIRHLKTATAIHPGSQEAHYFLGYALDRKYSEIDTSNTSTNLKQQLKPLKHFKKVISIAPKYDGEIIILDPYSRITSIWGNLALMYLFKGEADSALWAFQKGKKDGGFQEALIEYNKNTMACCEENGILFTNGDNDTYPMLYLQTVENYRTDITVVNLPTLNAHWYIKQLKNDNPSGINQIPAELTDEQIDNLSILKWKTQNMSVPVYNQNGEHVDDIIWTLRSTLIDQTLRVQDLMVMRILNDNRWQRPVYFSTTVSRTNLIGLDEYLALEGLVFRLVPDTENSNSINRLRKNVLEVCSYDAVILDETQNMPDVIAVAQNYRFCFFQLMHYYYKKDDVKMAQNILHIMKEKLPESKLPYLGERLRSIIEQYENELNQIN